MIRVASWFPSTVLLMCMGFVVGIATADENGYCVVVSQDTWEDPEWKAVTDVLIAKHSATVLTFQQSVAETLPQLRQQFPRYVCFVCTPDEATREFVAKVNRMSRQLDDDPYTDALWGILTGYDAAARCASPGRAIRWKYIESPPAPKWHCPCATRESGTVN